MRDRDYYPPGAYDDPSAPYNEPVIPDEEFVLTVSLALSKTVTVNTDKYIPEIDYETGHMSADTSETDWNEVYEEQHYTIPELLERLRVYAEEDLKNVDPKSGRGRELQRIEEACKGWIIDDYEVIEE